MVLNCCKEKEESIEFSSLAPMKIELSNIQLDNCYINISDFVSDISYIILSDEQLIGDIVQMEVIEDKIFVRCNNDFSIYMFSLNGEFVKKLFQTGQGPGETKCLSDFIYDEKRKIISFLGWGNYIYNYNIDGVFVNRESSLIGNRTKRLIGYSDDIRYYDLSVIMPTKGEKINPIGDYLLYGECVTNGQLISKYGNPYKEEKVEYRGIVAESEVSDFRFGRVDSTFWIKNAYMDSLYVFNHSSNSFEVKYIINLGENSLDYKSYLHLLYIDKDYVSLFENKIQLENVFLGRDYLIYKMRKKRNLGIGVYSLKKNRNILFTNAGLKNNLDDNLEYINVSDFSVVYCDGLYLYLPISAYKFFVDGNIPESLNITEESNPVILKLKLR